MGEGLHLGNIQIAVDVDGLALFGKDHRYAKLPGNHNGDSDAGGFNGEHLVNGLMAKTVLELPRDLLHEDHIHLVVQEAVYLQYIAGFDDAVLHNSLF